MKASRATRSPRAAAIADTLRRVDAPPPVITTPGWQPIGHIWSTVVPRADKVEWTWTHTPDGSYVSGFTLKTSVVKRS